MVEPIAWVRPDKTFTEVLCLGPVRPANATGNPDEWVPVFPPSYIATLEAEVSRLTALLDEAKVMVGPFAEASRMFDEATAHFGVERTPDNKFPSLRKRFTHGDLRAAHAFAEKAGA